MVALVNRIEDSFQRVLRPVSVSFRREKNYLTLDLGTSSVMFEMQTQEPRELHKTVLFEAGNVIPESLEAMSRDECRLPSPGPEGAKVAKGVMIRRGWRTDAPRKAALVGLALGMGACTACSPGLTLATKSKVAPVSSVTTSACQAEPTGLLQIREVRLSETDGQRSVRFQFSQPPCGIDYFPLREPSRLVIDVKGPIAFPPQAETYSTLDPLISAIRIGSYQGRIRLVIDMESEEIPPFSVYQHESVLTADIGHKKDGDISATPRWERRLRELCMASPTGTPPAAGAAVAGV